MCSNGENFVAEGISKIVGEKVDQKIYRKDVRYSLLDISDDIVLFWCEEDASLYSQKRQTSVLPGTSDSSYPVQVLKLTRPPIWEVECIILNKSSTAVLLVGSRGIVVVELPKRWGHEGLFEGGANTIICHTKYLGEQFFTCNLKIKVLSALWHPGSLLHEHIVVLSSDNYLRIYDIGALNNPEIISVGRSPIVDDNKSKYSATLGQEPVDFGIGTPIKCDEALMQKFETDDIEELQKKYLRLLWPIFILYNNGEVFYVISSLSDNRVHQRKLYGPMSMMPASFDNYGLDFCSICVLPSSPAILVIGNSSGTVHHCIILEDEPSCRGDNALDEDSELNRMAHNLSNAEYMLHVYETIHLDLSIVDNEKFSSTTLHLQTDTNTPARYWMTHEEGIHGVSVPMVERILQMEGFSDNVNLADEDLASRVEHFVCTRPVSSMNALAIIAVAFSSSHIYAVTASGVTYGVQVPTTFFPCIPPSSNGAQITKECNGYKESFSKYISDTLHRTSSQPLLISGSSCAVEGGQFVALLSQVTDTLNNNYMRPQAQAREILESRRRIQREQKSLMVKEMESVKVEKASCVDKAHQLAEGYEEACEKHEMLMARMEKLMSKIASDIPSLSSSERRMLSELEALKQRSGDFAIEIAQIQAKYDWQQDQISKTRDKTIEHQKRSTLSDNQLSSLRITLKNESLAIGQLNKKVASLKKQLDV